MQPLIGKRYLSFTNLHLLNCCIDQSTAAVFPAALAAITLGLVGHDHLDRRVGRNESFNHAGNLLAAILAALVGSFITSKGIFFLVAAMAVASAIRREKSALCAIAVLRIREKELHFICQLASLLPSW